MENNWTRTCCWYIPALTNLCTQISLSLAKYTQLILRLFLEYCTFVKHRGNSLRLCRTKCGVNNFSPALWVDFTEILQHICFNRRSTRIQDFLIGKLGLDVETAWNPKLILTWVRSSFYRWPDADSISLCQTIIKICTKFLQHQSLLGMCDNRIFEPYIIKLNGVATDKFWK